MRIFCFIFCKKILRIFCIAKDSHVFPTKNNSEYVILTLSNFNETLTNDVVNFEQPVPG